MDKLFGQVHWKSLLFNSIDIFVGNVSWTECVGLLLQLTLADSFHSASPGSWLLKLSIFGVFAKSAKPLKYRACQQKQGLGPLRCGSRWNLEKNIENVLVSGTLGRQVGPGMAVPGASGRRVGSGTAVSGALGHQVGPG